jgi:hypothetical protein
MLGAVTTLPTPELVENRRRSIAMLPPGAPALNRDEALEFLSQRSPRRSESCGDATTAKRP